MHNDLNILKLNDRRKLHLSMECHKSINNSSNSLSMYFKLMVTRATRAGENKMELPNLRTNMGRRAFSFRGPDHWDKLPADIKKFNLQQCLNQSI